MFSMGCNGSTCLPAAAAVVKISPPSRSSFTQPGANDYRGWIASKCLSRYPFLLPNLVGACLALALIPLVIIYVPETKDFETERVAQELSR